MFRSKNEMSGVYFWKAIKGNVGVHTHLIHKTEIHVQKCKGFLIMRLLIPALCFFFHYFLLLPDLEKRCTDFN